MLKTMFAIEGCRTGQMGRRADRCEHCGHIRVHYNSCRNRHCPQCQGLNQIKWADKLAADLLPVHYFHIVFTLPSELNRLALVNRQCVYNILFKAASESMLQLSRDKKHLGVYTGMVAILHTWGQQLMEHPHLHTMVPAGGWSETAQYWKYSKKKFFISARVLSEVFRGKFLHYLKEAKRQNKLIFEGEIKSFKQKRKFKQLLDTLYNKDWGVFCKTSSKSSTSLINYFATYAYRIAISNKRILGLENDRVVFRYKDYTDHGIQKIMKLPAEEFIRRFLLHILPAGFFKIRYYGLFSSRQRKLLLRRCRQALRCTGYKSKFTGLNWYQVLRLLTGKDLSVCPVCKTGKMFYCSLPDDLPVAVYAERAPPL